MKYTAASLTVMSNILGESKQDCVRMLQSVALREQANNAKDFNDLKALVVMLVENKFPRHNYLTDEKIKQTLEKANESDYAKQRS